MFNTITGDIAKIDQGQPHLAEKKSLATQHNEARYRAIHVLTELEVHPLFFDCSRQFCFNKSIQPLLQVIQNAPEPVESQSKDKVKNKVKSSQKPVLKL